MRCLLSLFSSQGDTERGWFAYCWGVGGIAAAGLAIGTGRADLHQPAAHRVHDRMSAGHHVRVQ